jgi:glycosyltransferase involved in cell wall biosynthesis
LVFNADGPGVRRLKTCLEQTGVCSSWIEEEFGQTLPDKEWVRQMQSAEVGIVTLVPGAETVAMPCKTYSAMLAGQAVLAICAPESDLANHVVQHDCGWVVAPGDCEGLLRVFGQISSQPGLLLRKRLNAHAAGHQHYSIEAVAAQWHSLLRELAADSLRPSAASA